jgi:hypothetical protein
LRIGTNRGEEGEGHSDPAITLRRYAHVLEDMREDAAIGRWASSAKV